MAAGTLGFVSSEEDFIYREFSRLLASRPSMTGDEPYFEPTEMEDMLANGYGRAERIAA